MTRNLSSKELEPSKLKTSIIPLLILLIIGSVIGVGIAGLFSFVYVSATASIWTVSHEIALVSVAITFGLFLVPVWGLLAGGLFSMNAVHSIRNSLNVKLIPEGHPIVDRVQELANKLNLPPVKYIGYYESKDINAFAAGVDPKSAMIAFTTGAIDRLSQEQFDAVMAHELGHIANNDMRRMTYARGFQDALTWFLMFRGLKTMARWLFTTISEIGILALSRAREYRADAVGSVLVGPGAMISALNAIEQDQVQPPSVHDRFETLLLQARPGGIFNSHPTFAQRIKAIETHKYIDELPLRLIQSEPEEFVLAPLAPEAFIR